MQNTDFSTACPKAVSYGAVLEQATRYLGNARTAEHE
jgi:hypothetical protein